MTHLGVVVVIALAACGSTDPDRSVEQPGAHEVGTATFVANDVARARELTVQAWFPTDTVATDVAIEQLETDAVRTRYAGLLAAAPACATRTLHVAPGAAIASGTFPVVVASHCHNCTRLSNATSAVRLASHGFIVLTVDHKDNTLWDHLAGNDASLDSAFLEIRAADIRFVIDALVAGAIPVSSAADLTRIGVLGHSFGAVTAGRVAELDARVKSAAALCAPMENPLILGVTLANIAQPVMFVVAVEDNSITEFGNLLVRNNFRDAPGAAWKIELPDAGHWSVSDLDGLVDIFKPGCGDGVRQTDGEPFTYLDPEAGRAITAAYVTAFFRATLNSDEGARAYLEQATPATVLVAHHE